MKRHTSRIDRAIYSLESISETQVEITGKYEQWRNDSTLTRKLSL